MLLADIVGVYLSLYVSVLLAGKCAIIPANETKNRPIRSKITSGLLVNSVMT